MPFSSAATVCPDAVFEIECICTWLMDPVACPTTWKPLLDIRQENPHYGQVGATAS